MGVEAGGLEGRTLSGWRIVRLLGAGGMGAVYEARHEGTGVRGAFKVLLDRAQEDDSLRTAARRLRDEATAAARVNCPHVARVLAAAEDDSVGPFIVFEYLAGETLRARLTREGRLPPDVVLSAVAEPLLSALAALHGAGILHRDVKPENLIAGADGRFRLTDLGLAIFEGREARTRTGGTMGTPGYLAPERLLSPDVAPGPACDLYGAAVVLVEALSGRKPFRGAGPAELVHDQVARDPSVEDLTGLGLGHATAALLSHALIRDCRLRSNDAAKLLQDLRAARTSDIARPDTSPTGLFAPAVVPRERAVTRRWIAPVALAALALMATAILWPHGGAPEPEPGPRSSPSIASQRLTAADVAALGRKLDSEGTLPDGAELRRFFSELTELLSDESKSAFERVSRELSPWFSEPGAATARVLALAEFARRRNELPTADRDLATALESVRSALVATTPNQQRARLDVERLLVARRLTFRAAAGGPRTTDWYDPFLDSLWFLHGRVAIEAILSPEGNAHRLLLRVALAEAAALSPNHSSGVAELAPGLAVLIRNPDLPPWARAAAQTGLARALTETRPRQRSDAPEPIDAGTSATDAEFARLLTELRAEGDQQTSRAHTLWTTWTGGGPLGGSAESAARGAKAVGQEYLQCRRRSFWAFDAAASQTSAPWTDCTGAFNAALDLSRFGFSTHWTILPLARAAAKHLLAPTTMVRRAAAEFVLVARLVGARAGPFAGQEDRWIGEAHLCIYARLLIDRVSQAAPALTTAIRRDLTAALAGAPVAHSFIGALWAWQQGQAPQARKYMAEAFDVTLSEQANAEAYWPTGPVGRRGLACIVWRSAWGQLRQRGANDLVLSQARRLRELIEQRTNDIALAAPDLRSLWGLAVTNEGECLLEVSEARSLPEDLRKRLERVRSDSSIDGESRMQAEQLLVRAPGPRDHDQ